MFELCHLRSYMLPRPSDSMSSCYYQARSATRLYGPIGFLAPVTVEAKIELWQLKIEWDEPLSDSYCKRWQELACDVEESIKMVLPRQYFTALASIACVY